MSKIKIAGHLGWICLMMLVPFGFTMGQDQTVVGMQTTTQRQLEDDTTHKSGWKKGIKANLGLAQGNTNNWAAGAEESSFSLNTYVNMFANLKRERHQWMNNLDLFYAVIRTTSQGTRKNDDRIDLFSKYRYQLSKKWGFGAVGNFRTQFTDGFDYDKVPKQKISGFLSPAYLTLGPGFDWQPTPYFSVFMSPLSGRWTYVSESSLATIYGLDPGKNLRTELGAYVTANFQRDIFKNVNLKSRLDLYSNYLKNPQNIDVFWTNVLTLKVNKFLNVTYNFDLIYDDDIRLFGPNETSPATQIKSLLSVNLTHSF